MPTAQAFFETNDKTHYTEESKAHYKKPQIHRHTLSAVQLIRKRL